MIVGGLILVVYDLLAYTIGLLPTGPSLGLNGFALTIASSSIWGHLGWANDYFPLSDLAVAIGVVLTMWGVFVILRLTIWILEKTHVVGGSE